MKSLVTRIKKDKEESKGFNMADASLIQINNELLNRLIIEIHYLTNEVLEQGRILRKLVEPKEALSRPLHVWSED